jgi:hypothetical protein
MNCAGINGGRSQGAAAPRTGVGHRQQQWGGKKRDQRMGRVFNGHEINRRAAI